MATFVSIPRRNSYRDFPPPPAVSHSRFSERFRDFGILGILGRETLFADFCRNARPGTGSSTTLGTGPSVKSNFLWTWIVGLGPGELAQGPGVSLCLGCIGFSNVPRIRSAHRPYLIHFVAMLWDHNVKYKSGVPNQS